MTFLLDLPELAGCLAAIPCPFVKFHGFAIVVLYVVAFLSATFGLDDVSLYSLGATAFITILMWITSGVCAYFNFSAEDADTSSPAAAAEPVEAPPTAAPVAEGDAVEADVKAPAEAAPVAEASA
jgi:hypothetical protein